MTTTSNENSESTLTFGQRRLLQFFGLADISMRRKDLLHLLALAMSNDNLVERGHEACISMVDLLLILEEAESPSDAVSDGL